MSGICIAEMRISGVSMTTIDAPAGPSRISLGAPQALTSSRTSLCSLQRACSSQLYRRQLKHPEEHSHKFVPDAVKRASYSKFSKAKKSQPVLTGESSRFEKEGNRRLQMIFRGTPVESKVCPVKQGSMLSAADFPENDTCSIRRKETRLYPVSGAGMSLAEEKQLSVEEPKIDGTGLFCSGIASSEADDVPSNPSPGTLGNSEHLALEPDKRVHLNSGHHTKERALGRTTEIFDLDTSSIWVSVLVSISDERTWSAERRGTSEEEQKVRDTSSLRGPECVRLASCSAISSGKLKNMSSSPMINPGNSMCNGTVEETRLQIPFEDQSENDGRSLVTRDWSIIPWGIEVVQPTKGVVWDEQTAVLPLSEEGTWLKECEDTYIDELDITHTGALSIPPCTTIVSCTNFAFSNMFDSVPPSPMSPPDVSLCLLSDEYKDIQITHEGDTELPLSKSSRTIPLDSFPYEYKKSAVLNKNIVFSLPSPNSGSAVVEYEGNAIVEEDLKAITAPLAGDVSTMPEARSVESEPAIFETNGSSSEVLLSNNKATTKATTERSSEETACSMKMQKGPGVKWSETSYEKGGALVPYTPTKIIPHHEARKSACGNTELPSTSREEKRKHAHVAQPHWTLPPDNSIFVGTELAVRPEFESPVVSEPRDAQYRSPSPKFSVYRSLTPPLQKNNNQESADAIGTVMPMRSMTFQTSDPESSDSEIDDQIGSSARAGKVLTPRHKKRKRPYKHRKRRWKYKPSSVSLALYSPEYAASVLKLNARTGADAANLSRALVPVSDDPLFDTHRRDANEITLKQPKVVSPNTSEEHNGRDIELGPRGLQPPKQRKQDERSTGWSSPKLEQLQEKKRGILVEKSTAAAEKGVAPLKVSFLPQHRTENLERTNSIAATPNDTRQHLNVVPLDVPDTSPLKSDEMKLETLAPTASLTEDQVNQNIPTRQRILAPVKEEEKLDAPGAALEARTFSAPLVERHRKSCQAHTADNVAMPDYNVGTAQKPKGLLVTKRHMYSDAELISDSEGSVEFPEKEKNVFIPNVSEMSSEASLEEIPMVSVKKQEPRSDLGKLVNKDANVDVSPTSSEVLTAEEDHSSARSLVHVVPAGRKRQLWERDLAGK